MNHNLVNKSHVLLTDITDHLPCISIIKNGDYTIKGYKHVTTRMINDANRLKFTKEIDKIKDILAFQASNKSEHNIENRYKNYFDHLGKIYNQCFPLTTKKIHSKTLSKPWITPHIEKLIDKKNKRFSIKNKNNTDINNTKYKIAKKEMQKAIDVEKKKYFKNLLEETNDNIKQKWNAIRLIINRKKETSNNCILPNNILGQHYSTVAEKLAEKLPKITKNDIPSTSKIKKSKNPPNNFVFTSITQRQVYELILRLDSTKGPGIDNIDIKSLKSIANIISHHLTSLFNDSIKTGIYPQCLKTSICIPIYKGNPLDPTDPVNYRPISILTSINKIFEQCLHTQLSQYMELNNLLPKFQYGYRKNHNTSQAILDYANYINNANANKLVTIAIFMDLSKAFDTVDKTILKHKLHELGLAELSTSLIDSYMSDRKFCMKNDDKHYMQNYGVPQGSILGLLLFIMYTFDMTDITRHNKVIVYADDTTVLVSGKNLTEAKQQCNDILERFNKYFTLNKLSINPSKTKFMIHKPTYKHNRHKYMHDTTNTKLIMDGIPLKQVNSIKFLGVMINEKLNWECHKKLICNKISKTIGLIYKCKEFLNTQDCIRMYKTFIQPHFTYAIEAWGHTVQSDSDILVKLQSKVLRIVLNCKRTKDAWRHTIGTVKDIRNLYTIMINKLSMKHHYGALPINFSLNIMPEFNIEQLENNIIRISLKTMYDYKNSKKVSYSKLKYNCIRNWNSLPFDVKVLPYLSGKESIYKSLKYIA